MEREIFLENNSIQQSVVYNMNITGSSGEGTAEGGEAREGALCKG